MDLIKWKVYLEEEELNGTDRQDYYLAQIAQYIHAANAKKGEVKNLDRYLLKFTKQEPPKKETELTLDEKKRKMLLSRGAWANYLGIYIPVDDLLEAAEETPS